MPPRLPTPTQGSMLALIAVVAAVTIATTLDAAGGNRASTCSGQGVRPAFEICGDLQRPLVPGTSQPIDMRISNPTRHRLKITRVTVSLKLDTAHRTAGCIVASNFRVTGLGPGQYPLEVPPRSTRSLQVLGVAPLPRVRMLNLASTQDACKTAKLRLRFNGEARRSPRIVGT